MTHPSEYAAQLVDKCRVGNHKLNKRAIHTVAGMEIHYKTCICGAHTDLT